MKLFDSHAHLLDNKFKNDIEDVIQGVDGIICIYSPCEDFNFFKKLLNKNFIWGAAGIHPHEAKNIKQLWNGLKTALKLDKVMAVGEIGLDFYYNNSPEEIQKEVFKKQLKLAEKIHLPVIIHSRNAFKDTLEILESYKVKKVLIHCFSGTVDEMRESVKRGYYIAVGGVITFPNAIMLKEVIKEVPMNKILLETDCPYLAPVPHRGKRNQPSYLKYIAREAAKIKGLELGETTRNIYENTLNFLEAKPRTLRRF